MPRGLERRSKPLMSVGRNELCPCGSGKKYKKCCGQVTLISELRSRHEQKLQKEYASWVERLNHFVGSHVTSDAVSKARSLFAEEVGLDEEKVIQPEWAAHFFNWFVLDVQRDGGTLLQMYLKRHGRRMEPDLKRSFLQLHLNVYEIVGEERDVLIIQQPMTLERLYLLKPHHVRMQVGQLIVGRLLNLGLRNMLFSGSIILQPHIKPSLLDWLRQHPEVNEAGENSEKRVYTTALYRVILQFGSEGSQRQKPRESLLRRSFPVEDPSDLLKRVEAQRSFELKKRDSASEVWVYAPRREEHLFPTLKDALLELFEVQGELILQNGFLHLEGYREQLDEITELLQLALPQSEEEIRVLTSTGARLTRGTLFITSQPALPPKVLQWAVKTYFAEKWLVTPHEALNGLAPILVAASDNRELRGKLEALMEQMEQDGRLGQGISRFIQMEILRPRLSLKNDSLNINNLLRRPLIEGLPESAYTVNPDRLAEIHRFVLEMTEGKSEATVKKYDEVMNNFRSFVRGAFGPAFAWEHLRPEDLAFFLLHDIYSRADAVNKTLAANLLSVLSAFFKWLDKQDGTSVATRMQPFLAELKDVLPETYRMHNAMEKEAYQRLFGAPSALAEVMAEPVILLNKEQDYWLARRANGQTIKLVIEEAEGLQENWMIAALFGRAEDGFWRLYSSPELYPPVVAQMLGAPVSVPV